MEISNSKYTGTRSQVYRFFLRFKNEIDIDTLFIPLVNYMVNEFGEKGVLMDNLAIINPLELCKCLSNQEDTKLYKDITYIIASYKLILQQEQRPEKGLPLIKYQEAEQYYLENYKTFNTITPKRKRIPKEDKPKIEYVKKNEDYPNVYNLLVKHPQLKRVDLDKCINKSLRDVMHKHYGDLYTLLPFKKITDQTNAAIYWLCKCSCGNYCLIRNCDLYYKTNCGLKRHIRQYKGTKHDHLECIEELWVPNKNNLSQKQILKVQCDCGSVFLCDSTYYTQHKLCCAQCPEAFKYSKRFYKRADIKRLAEDKRSLRYKNVYPGVSKINSTGKFIAYIDFRCKHYHLGTYNKCEDAYYIKQQADKIVKGDWLKDNNILNDIDMKHNHFLQALFKEALEIYSKE